MGSLFYLFFPWGVLLQIAAVIHFIRRRPDTYWLWIIIFFGPLGALIYLAAEALPDVHLKTSFQWVHRRHRLHELEIAVLDNPAPGNYEELGELYSETGNYLRARECFNKAITPRSEMPAPFYGRALCAMQLGDYPAAVSDLQRVVTFERKYDYQRALGLLAHAYAQVGDLEKADACFREATETSTLSETQYNFATFLAGRGEITEARDFAQRILNKKATLPRFLRRQERPWFRRAEAFLKQHHAPAA